MHILDLIMYFVTAGLLWFLLGKFSGGDLTEELGGVIGLLVELLYLLWYFYFFWYLDNNWVDFPNWFKLNITL